MDASALQNEANLVELILVARPEEKYEIERALSGVAAPTYVSFPALGRGRHGGLAYAARKTWIKWPWSQHPMAALLPKVAYVMVIPETEVDAVLGAIGAVLRFKGGPADCGLGFAVVSPLGVEVPITPTHRGATPAAPVPAAVHPANVNLKSYVDGGMLA